MLKERVCVKLKHVHKIGVRCELIQINPLDGAEGEKLGAWTFADYEGKSKLKELGEEIFDAAQGQADEDGRSRKFKLVIYNNEDDIVPGGFGMIQHAESEGVGTSDDDASAEGIVRQSIRHTERMFELTHKANEQTMRVMADQIEVLTRRVIALEKRETQVTELARSLYEQGENSQQKELFYNRVDRSLGILAEDIMPAIGKELGILPENFKLGRDLDEYKAPGQEEKQEEQAENVGPDTTQG
jgi:hypothetical protein